MSADNFVGVMPRDDGTYAIYEYGCMSILDEDCMYLKDEQPTIVAPDRGAALLQAHDMVNKMYICEYGVIELAPRPHVPCGRCWVCVHQRGIADDSLPTCSVCHKPISEGDWQQTTYDVALQQVITIHASCERR